MYHSVSTCINVCVCVCVCVCVGLYVSTNVFMTCLLSETERASGTWAQDHVLWGRRQQLCCPVSSRCGLCSGRNRSHCCCSGHDAPRLCCWYTLLPAATLHRACMLGATLSPLSILPWLESWAKLSQKFVCFKSLFSLITPTPGVGSGTPTRLPPPHGKCCYGNHGRQSTHHQMSHPLARG